MEPIEEMRRRVKQRDAALRPLLRKVSSPPRELEDLRTEIAQERIALRKREEAEALQALRDAG